MAERALTAEQRRAAALLGAGLQVREVAAEIGVNPRTITRWSRRGDVAALARRHREVAMPGVATAEGVLEAALAATRANGQPDWQARITAARALLTAPTAAVEAKAKAARIERVYITRDA